MDEGMITTYLLGSLKDSLARESCEVSSPGSRLNKTSGASFNWYAELCDLSVIVSVPGKT